MYGRFGNSLLLNSKLVGLAAAGLLTGTLLTHSVTTTPLLLTSPNHEIILRQSRYLRKNIRRSIAIFASISTISLLATSYLRFHRRVPYLRYIISASLISGVIPYRFLVMRSTEDQLDRLYEEEVEGMGFEIRSKEQEVIVKGEVRGLVDWWGVLNLGRAVGAGVAFVIAIAGFP